MLQIDRNPAITAKKQLQSRSQPRTVKATTQTQKKAPQTEAAKRR
jgi:hypothetical protein